MEFAKQAPGTYFPVIQLIPKLLCEKCFAPRAQRKRLLCSTVKSRSKSALRRGISALQPAFGTSGLINRLNGSGVMADAGVETTGIGYTAVFYSRLRAAAEKQPHAHGASGRSCGSSLLSSAATITIRMGQAGVGAAPAGGSVTLSTVTTE